MKKKRFAIAAILIFLGGFTSLLIYGCFVRFDKGENVASVSWLPKEATNISYYRSYVFTAYEFDISEKGFIEWSKSYITWSKWEMNEITKTTTIPRYTMKTNNSTVSKSEDEDSMFCKDGPIAKVEHGLCYSHFASNGGGIIIVYDRDCGRVYVNSRPR